MFVNFLVIHYKAIIALLMLILSIPPSVYYLRKLISSIYANKYLRNTDNVKFDRDTIILASQCYVKPRCGTADPTQGAELSSLNCGNKLFKEADKFIKKDYINKFMIVFGDSGTGKTSFVLNYYIHLRKIIEKCNNVFALPMGHKNTNTILLNCKNKENTILLLDAFDEDHNAISNHVERLFDIFVICSDFYKVIITCRTQLFYDDDEIPSETNIKRHGPQSASDKGIYGVLRYYIYPFNDKEVRRYFNKYYFFWSIRKKQRAKKIAKSIPYLSARPMLLTHIPDIMNYNSSIETLSDLYDVMFKAWVDRENYWVEKEELIGLSNKLAIDIYNNSDLRGMEKIPHNEIEQVTKALFINLNKWQITSRSLLNRDSEGNYKFSHRSIMEYLYVKNFLSGNSECEGRILTDQMKIFAIDSLSVHDARITELKDFLMLVNVKIGYFKLGEIYPVMHDYDEYSHNLINRLMGLTCTNHRIDNEEKKHVIREFIIDDSNNKIQFLSDTVWGKKKYYLSLRFAKSYYRFGDDHITIWPLNCEVEIDKKDMSKIMSSMKYLRELVGVIANSKNKRILSRYGFDIYKKIIDINRSEYIQVIPELPYFNDVILLIRKDN